MGQNPGTGSNFNIFGSTTLVLNFAVFINFLFFSRVELDENNDSEADHKGKFEVWLDFVLLCDQIFELPRSESAAKKIQLFIDVGEK